MYLKKIHQFLSSIKKMHTEENWFIFFCITVDIRGWLPKRRVPVVSAVGLRWSMECCDDSPPQNAVLCLDVYCDANLSCCHGCVSANYTKFDWVLSFTHNFTTFAPVFVQLYTGYSVCVRHNKTTPTTVTLDAAFSPWRAIFRRFEPLITFSVDFVD